MWIFRRKAVLPKPIKESWTEPRAPERPIDFQERAVNAIAMSAVLHSIEREASCASISVEDAALTSYGNGMIEMLLVAMNAMRFHGVEEILSMLERNNLQRLSELSQRWNRGSPDIRVFEEDGDGLPYIIDGIVTYDPPSETGYGMR